MLNRSTIAAAATLAAGTFAVLPTGARATTPTTPGVTCSNVPDGLRLVLAGAGAVGVVGAGAAPLDPAVPPGPSVAMRGPDGTTWWSTGTLSNGDQPGFVEISRLRPGSGDAEVVASGTVWLGGVGWSDGRTAATYVDANEPDTMSDPTDSYGSVVVDHPEGDQSVAGVAVGPEFGVVSAMPVPDGVVIGAITDLTESFIHVGADGTEREDWIEPIGPEEYAQPPFHQWPVAAGFADQPTISLSWVEGPDTSFDSPDQAVGEWTLQIVDARTGDGGLTVDLGRQPEETLERADYDGRFWIGTFASEETSSVIAVEAVEGATPVDLGCGSGVVATIDRLGTPAPMVVESEAAPAIPAATSPAPTAPAAPVPTSTAPPAPAPAAPAEPAPEPAPGGCGRYTPAPDRYPIRRCQEGFNVVLVQNQLTTWGFDVSSDGYFGPATETAVREFQAREGLEVDGLVGVDTWRALSIGSVAGDDADGSGLVDPWEVIFGGD